MSQERWDTHWDAGHNWALVLAGGEGTRLQALTRLASGIAVPKQFCSLGHSGSLLHDAVARAGLVTSPERITIAVSEHHRHWWQDLNLRVPSRNLISQPSNRGTAQGILLPLLHILHRDPEASILVLPSDHYVSNELVLGASLREAMAEIIETPEGILLLGMAAEEADPELGYIVAEGAGDVSAVRDFLEKPDVSTARSLIAHGGMWNSFIFAARGQSLLRRFEQTCPDLVGEMRHIVTSVPASSQTSRLADLYARSPTIDFSRSILQHSASSLRVMRVPACGWSDLGTPRRVTETVRRMRSQASGVASLHSDASAYLNLAGRTAMYATG
ncbi:MAG TPA: sugar phosphate nucleotidyltransferase [Steroidobacter sp.]|uniref:sugar phosphate nucleotidyltransferase n=1 Tax=Steroidobacter sp. TaxID=1978227 RepID=UPI002EDA3D0E